MRPPKFCIQLANQVPILYPIQVQKGSAISKISLVAQMGLEVQGEHQIETSLHPVLQQMFEKQSTELNLEQKHSLQKLSRRHSCLFLKDENDIGYCDLIHFTVETGYMLD